MDAIAAGMVLFLHLPEKEIDRYLFSANLKPFTPYTITDPKKLREEVQEICGEALA